MTDTGQTLYTRRAFAGLSTVALATVSLSGCTLLRKLAVSDGQGYLLDYAIAVVKSNVIIESTFIEYYDESLALINKIEYPYSTLENTWGKPERSGDEVLLAAQGIEGIRRSKVVVGLNTTTGAITEYDVGIGILKNCTANERFVYASRNLNASSAIARVDRQTGEKLRRDYPGLLYPYAWGDKVYAFNSHRPGEPKGAHLLVLDEALDLLETIDFDDRPTIVQITGFIDGRLYFVFVPGEDTDADWAVTRRNLRYLTPEDNKVHDVITLVGKRLGYVAVRGTTLYVLVNADVTGGSRNKIVAIDAQKGIVTGEFALSYEPSYLYLKGDVLYVTGYDDEVGYDLVLGAYELGSTGDISPVGEVHFENHEEGRKGRFYLTGLFSTD